MSRLQSVIYNGVPALDPQSLYREMMDRNLPVESWFGKANSITCPLGEGPGIGHILLTGRDVTTLQARTTTSPCTDVVISFTDDPRAR